MYAPNSIESRGDRRSCHGCRSPAGYDDRVGSNRHGGRDAGSHRRRSTLAGRRSLRSPESRVCCSLVGRELRTGGSAVRPVAYVRVAVAVVGGAEQTEIVGFCAAAERERQDVIHLHHMPGATTASAAPVHVAAAAPITLPDLSNTVVRLGPAIVPLVFGLPLFRLRWVLRCSEYLDDSRNRNDCRCCSHNYSCECHYYGTRCRYILLQPFPYEICPWAPYVPVQ